VYDASRNIYRVLVSSPQDNLFEQHPERILVRSLWCLWPELPASSGCLARVIVAPQNGVWCKTKALAAEMSFPLAVVPGRFG
jgi:hypothetical protein